MATARHASANHFEDRLVWILGSSRSGSTWLLRMLEHLLGAVPIDDPHLGHHLGVWRPIPLAWAASEEPPELATVSDLRHDKPDYFFSDKYADAWRPGLRDLILTRFAAQADGSRSRVIVKEPGSQAAELLLSLFPRSHLIFLLRDGRDVVDSWLAGYRDGAWAQDEGAFPLASHGRKSFIRWQASVWCYRVTAVSRAYGRHRRDRRVLTRYEDLLSDPEAELARICEVMDANVDRERDRRGSLGPQARRSVSPTKRTGTSRSSGQPGWLAQQPDCNRATNNARRARRNVGPLRVCRGGELQGAGGPRPLAKGHGIAATRPRPAASSR